MNNIEDAGVSETETEDDYSSAEEYGIDNEIRTHSPPKSKTSMRPRGRPPKQVGAPAQPTGDITDDAELDAILNDLNDHEEAQCVPNGRKAIECYLCGKHDMTRIYELRAHMQRHTEVVNFDDKTLEAAPIYKTLNPHQRNIDTNVIRDFLINEIKAKRYTQFYAILTEAGIGLHISDSETESETEHADIPRNIYKCDLCQTSFDRRHKALFHQHTSHAIGQLPFRCHYCGRQYVSVQLLIHHLKTQCESDERPIACMERFRQYLLQVNLEQFECLAQARKEIKLQRLETAEKIYACSVCEKTFLRNEHLTRHKAVHLPDAQKMECPVCYKKFNRKDNLRTHMKVHVDQASRDTTNNQEPILCQYCGHCFTSKSNYVVHMRRHTGDKPYTCDVCGKGFAKSTDLNTHKMTHTGERNFVCKICSRTFVRAAVLNKHMRVHLGPFHCTYCTQSFQRPNELANHLRLHATRARSYACVTCKQTFETKELLELHFREEQHSNDRAPSEQQTANTGELVATHNIPEGAPTHQMPLQSVAHTLAVQNWE